MSFKKLIFLPVARIFSAPLMEIKDGSIFSLQKKLKHVNTGLGVSMLQSKTDNSKIV
jgi:hypothetical protein